jgi:hypothetical protein
MKSENSGPDLGSLLQMSPIKKKFVASEAGIPASRLSEYFTASRNLSEEKLESLRDVLISLDRWTRKQVDASISATNSYYEETNL